MEWSPFLLSFRLALVTTSILFLAGVPLAFWLSRTSARARLLVEAFVILPLVLPPSVLGFYLLLGFSPVNPLGAFLERHLDTRLVFTFPGLVVASLLYNLPFMLQPLISGFRSLPSSLIEASYTLGKSRATTLLNVVLPNSMAACITACVLTFAHTVGEFGVVLMVGGNIPGQTRVVSIALFDLVEAMRYGEAHRYAATLVLLSLFVLFVLYFVNLANSNSRRQ